ncbi:NAD(P)-binding Rossmann-fold containing protein [Glarea lozoyensis ATCC 20868]|uniref:NAD(P)-binding Rossmann-fold containing protein n=1 Tax=Glarea lozoyensis (strain ATCC 20868 / MF5171) TaxID=1116229 RepID=S3ED88_GLAL2|nr:NAD(P)-binding Rossmann-fold containing protein [Glarea lozoyensis ATCC 20868]EPE36263.1 NAD(P)-binding Rossmann-fold containing protein [Glarea lozoyensis ATCC 20868]
MSAPPSDYLIRQSTFTRTTYQDEYPTIYPTNPENSQTGKVIVITGAGKGLGRHAFAKSFAKAGAKAIVISARKEAILEEVKKDILAINKDIEVLAVPVDVTDKKSVDNLWAKVKENYGTADVLINNAGILNSGGVGEISADDWWSDFETNVRGTFLVSQGYLKLLGKEKKGSIINLSSALALVTMPNTSSYGLSKLAILQLQKFISTEYPNVFAVGIHPGILMTDIVAESLKPFAKDTYELTGGFAVWLSTEQASFLNGRYVSANWSVDELVERKEEIVSEGKLLVGIKGEFGEQQFA